MLRQAGWNTEYKNGTTPWRDKTPERIKQWLDRTGVLSGKALVLGCGTGEHAIWLADNGFEVEALDYSETALEQAQSLSKKVKWQLWDLENLDNYKFVSKKYDIILDVKVVAFITNLQTYLKVISTHLEGFYIIEAFLRHDEKPGITVTEDAFEKDLSKYFRIAEKRITALPYKVIAMYYCKVK